MTIDSGITAVVPVKPWRLAKSRIDMAPAGRQLLARAFTLDVLDAVLCSPKVHTVVIVTAESELLPMARSMKVQVLADRPLVTRDPLNTAVAIARHWALLRRPQDPIVVVPADLPAMTTDVFIDTTDILARHETAFVTDAIGTGSTLVWATSPDLLWSGYGAQSAARHSAAGMCSPSKLDLRARIDVDTSQDLLNARDLGVGPHTTSALRDLATNLGRSNLGSVSKSAVQCEAAR
jgi:2-phospho-L-lactate guanylyltransferase